MAEWAVEKGANDWNCALESACQGGYLKMVELAIEKGDIDWNYALEIVCQDGYQEISEWLISLGADHCGFCDNKRHVFT